MRDMMKDHRGKFSGEDLNRLACAVFQIQMSKTPSLSPDELQDAVCLALVQFLEHGPPHLVEAQALQWLITATVRNIGFRRRGNYSGALPAQVSLEEDEERMHRILLCHEVLRHCREVYRSGRTETAVKMFSAGYSHCEIAAETGLEPATVRQRLHRFFRRVSSLCDPGVKRRKHGRAS